MATDSSAENRASTQRFTRSRLNDTDRRRMAENLLLWSGNGRVFALEGNLSETDLQLMANSLR